ncbi:hypothetical protein DTL42_03025 [Bremerella cremea]|uniref:Uncharacterized protein n=1 Tax=Bremerella cremea TaxID=1031537 RepID=A0A368KWW4_9BACT|nr:hypothetical protein [Bremerella cremea]RCS54137.1 hypothetical protein DTL42_03025 [Bremerella cremea]
MSNKRIYIYLSSLQNNEYVADDLFQETMLVPWREDQSGALVHGFASGSHATLPAPMLSLVHQE